MTPPSERRPERANCGDLACSHFSSNVSAGLLTVLLIGKQFVNIHRRLIVVHCFPLVIKYLRFNHGQRSAKFIHGYLGDASDAAGTVWGEPAREALDACTASAKSNGASDLRRNGGPRE